MGGKVTGTTKQPPKGAAKRIRELAADGWSIVGVAQHLGASKDLLAAWMKASPKLQQAFDEGREKERHTLHNLLYRKAVEKNDTTAAMCILNARHGYRTDEGGQIGPNLLLVALPAALSPDQWRTRMKPIDGPNGEG